MLKTGVIFSKALCKKGRLPKGDEFLQDTSQEKILRMIDQTPSGKARDILVACHKRKAGMSLHAISEAMMRPYSTIRGWLVRIAKRGLAGRFDKKSTGRKRMLGEHAVGMIKAWLHGEPSKFGFESASWSTRMLLEAIRRRIGTSTSARTPRRVLHRLRSSYTKPRPVPRRSATAEDQKRFKEETAESILGMVSDGYAVLAGDEAGIQLGASAGYGWRPVGGGNTVSTTFSIKSSRMFGALSSDRIHVKDVEYTNSETFKDFLTDMRQTYGKFVMILDNASYHRTDTVKDFVNDTKGDIRLIFLPPYTPQLNPIEVQWRMIKKMLAGRQLKTPDEVADIVKKIINTGEMKPVKLMKYLTP